MSVYFYFGLLCDHLQFQCRESKMFLKNRKCLISRVFKLTCITIKSYCTFECHKLLFWRPINTTTNKIDIIICFNWMTTICTFNLKYSPNVSTLLLFNDNEVAGMYIDLKCLEINKVTGVRIRKNCGLCLWPFLPLTVGCNPKITSRLLRRSPDARKASRHAR